jgi:hypothetical protein
VASEIKASPVVLQARPRRFRLTAVAATLTLVLAGSLWGGDTDFPFGPFRMYSTRDDPNGVVSELRVQVVIRSGAVVDVTNASGAPRRAELEGRIAEITSHPSILVKLVPLYTRHVAAAAQLRLVWEHHQLEGGRSQPAYDDVICSVPVHQ